MSELAPHTVRDLEALSALVEMDLAMAKRLCAAALAETDNAKAERLGRAYHRAARSVRQTIWLKQRILQGRVAPISTSNAAPAAAPTAAPAPAASRPQPSAPVADHLAQRLRTAELGEGIGRVIVAYTEHEREVAERENLDEPLDDERFEHLWDGLEAQMNKRAPRPGQPDRPIDDEIMEACAELDLPPDLAARWRDLPPIVSPEEMVAIEAAEAEAAGPPLRSSG